MPDSGNMELWKSVCVTPPNITKEFKGRGGFKGTSANPMYLAERCTEVFGQCGKGWGTNELEHVVAGTDDEKIWASHVEFWYAGMDGDVRVVHKISQWGSAMLTEIRGRTGNNPYTFVDPEAPKKARTNGMSKCLSLLGFCADLWLGYYNSDDYQQFAAQHTEDRKRMESNENAAALLATLLDTGIGCKTDEDRDKVLSWACGRAVSFDEVIDAGGAAQAQTEIKAKRRTAGITYPEILEAARKGAK